MTVVVGCDGMEDPPAAAAIVEMAAHACGFQYEVLGRDAASWPAGRHCVRVTEAAFESVLPHLKGPRTFKSGVLAWKRQGAEHLVRPWRDWISVEDIQRWHRQASGIGSGVIMRAAIGAMIPSDLTAAATRGGMRDPWTDAFRPTQVY